MSDVRFIAFFLTQFHPTAENDAWWGRGFTEWTNVTRAEPLFDGHYQPHLPADLGFYDLRLAETRHAQIALAKQYGVDAFCYHYYWFSGRRLLNRPLDDMLADPASDMPFCLSWANENWTRRWNAAENEVLVAQHYLPDDDDRFIDGLLPIFADPRYIRIEGRPLLIVYRPQHLPDVRKSLAVWRERARTAGFDGLYLCSALTHGNAEWASSGFDGGIQFPPHNLLVENVNRDIAFHAPFRGNVIEFADAAANYLRPRADAEPAYRTVVPSWDNTARTRERAMVFLNGTPANYEFWLKEAVRLTQAERPPAERLVFLNAWNEWAEGCHLEPDARYGHAFLEATLRVKNGVSAATRFVDRGLTGHEAPPRRLFTDLRDVALYHLGTLSSQLRLRINRRPQLKRSLTWLMRLWNR